MHNTTRYIKSPKEILYRWTAFFAGIAAIWFVSQVLAPLGNAYLPGMERLMLVTEAKGIRPGQFWYSDVETSGAAYIFTSSSTRSDLGGFKK